GYLGVTLVLIAVILKLVFFILSIELLILFIIFGIIFIFFIPIILVYTLFHTYKPVLGAFDNLSGVSVILGIAKYLKQQTFLPKNTKIYLISFAGEESGLRGSKRYVSKHLNELKSGNVSVVNMDSIAKKDIVVIHDKESGIGVKHDFNIYTSLMEISKKKQLNARLMSLPFGATDAAAFSKKKIPAVSVGGLNLKEELPNYYHTRNDTLDVIEKEALGQIVGLCIDFLKEIDL
ncbi:MAG: M28 family metallopeptidase, partial [Candidatus Thorarchaeota archaeon]